MTIFENYPLIAALSSILFAQFVKFPIAFFTRKKGAHLSLMTSTGGMPSSHSAAVTSLITSLGLEKWFDSSRIFISEATGVPKPQAEAFKNVEQLFPNLSPNDFWMIGDDLVNDIEGAKNRNWNTIYFKFGEEDSTLTPKPLSSPTELLEKLEKEAFFGL